MLAVSSVAIQPRTPIWPALVAPLVSGVYYMHLLVLLFALASVQVFAQAPPARIVIQAGTVSDCKGAVLRNQQIVIEGATIRSVAAGTARPTYDLRALTVMPGWIDTHVHMNWHMDANHKSVSGGDKPEDAALYTAGDAWITLLGGFTTVQSVGAAIDGVVRDRIAQGMLPGPRLLTSLRQINDRSGDAGSAAGSCTPHQVGRRRCDQAVRHGG
jgi:imidazolonepropionase-like amidohydrolase